MTKKTNELKKLSKAQMEEKKKELKKELIKLNAQISTGTPPENPGRVREVKKTIARLNTFMSQKTEQEDVKKQ